MHALEKLHKAWGSGHYPPTTVSESDLVALETELQLGLPKSYRLQVLEFGLPQTTTDLWEWLDDREEARFEQYGATLTALFTTTAPHLSEFHAPQEMLNSLSWRNAGMPEHLLPFANDSQGNQICFDLSVLRKSPGAKSAVYFWDHDFNNVEKLAKNFDQFIGLFLP